jgi:hypothetical protein
MNTGWSPCGDRSRQLKLSFNKSGEKSFSTPKRGVLKTRGPRHGYDRFGIPFRPGSRTRRIGETAGRTPRLLAEVYRHGVQPVPPGTALYARPGTGLARQASKLLATKRVRVNLRNCRDARRSPLLSCMAPIRWSGRLRADSNERHAVSLDRRMCSGCGCARFLPEARYRKNQLIGCRRYRRVLFGVGGNHLHTDLFAPGQKVEVAA